MWRDSETELDFLDFDYLIEILKYIVDNENLLPSSIGLYGDWGSGKSSLMNMCKKKLEAKDDGTVCLLFNGWLYEGYDDAKTAILGSILDGIKENRSLKGTAKEIINTLYKSVNKFKLIKNTAVTGLDLFLTGGLATLTNITTREIVGEARAKADDAKPENVISEIKEALDYKELREDIRVFREEFEKLLEASGINKLVIFIDELDRCSPNTILDTLEAMRLFLFTGNVAFVIGADERHIAYAIKSKFNDIDGINMDIGKEYQEKLIQYPIRIPRLNENETKFYIMCLLAQEHLEENVFNDMVEKLRNKKKENFLDFELTYKVVKEVNENIADLIKDDIITAQQIAPILSKGLNGNPRQCKRFLNSVDMRKKMAEYRGIKLNTKVLAKIMELEYFRPNLLKVFAKLLDENILMNELQYFENKRYDELRELEKWKDDKWVCEWFLIEPTLSNENLKTYFYFMRESLDNKSLINTSKLSDKAQKTIERLSTYSDIVLRSSIKEIEEFTEQDVIQILDFLYNNMIQDDMIDSIKFKFFINWGAQSRELQISTIEYLNSINGIKIKSNDIPFIEGFYEDCKDKNAINLLLDKWGNENANIKGELKKIMEVK